MCEMLKVSRLVFELSSAHIELNSDNPGWWRRGHGSKVVVEEEWSLLKSRTLVGVAPAITGADRACWQLHEARLSWRRSDVAANRLRWRRNARLLRDSKGCWDDSSAVHRRLWAGVERQLNFAVALSPFGRVVGMAKIGAAQKRDEGLTRREERESHGRREKYQKKCFFCLFLGSWFLR